MTNTKKIYNVKGDRGVGSYKMKMTHEARVIDSWEDYSDVPDYYAEFENENGKISLATSTTPKDNDSWVIEPFFLDPNSPGPLDDRYDIDEEMVITRKF